MAKSLRDRLKSKMKQLTEEANQSGKYNYSGGMSYYTLPEGVSEWKPSPGKDGKGELHRLDIIPFMVGDIFPDQTWQGPNPPRKEEEGAAMRIDLNVHFRVGPDNVAVVCPKHSFRSGIAKGNKKGCPICELREAKMSAISKGDPERERLVTEINAALKPKRRCLYNVVIRDDGDEEEKGVQIYEVSYNIFQTQLNAAQEMLRKEGEGVVEYADQDDGRLILLNAYTKNTKEFDFTDISSVKFKDRMRGKKEYIISDEELEQAHDPATFLNLYSYEEISDLISEETVKTKQKVEEIDEEDDPPFESRKAKAEKKEEKVKEEEYDGDEDEDACPHGYELGKDYLDHDECSDCEGDVYRTCMQAHKLLRRANKETKKK